MTHYSNTRNPIDFPKKKDIPLLERFAAQSLVNHGGELIFSKEKFAELIVREMVDECAKVCVQHAGWTPDMIAKQVKQHFGVES